MTKADKNEEWRASDIQGYSVSSLGRVMNVGTRKVTCGVDNGEGYRRIFVRQNQHRFHVYVHRLVGMAFLPNPEGHPTINHKNLNRSDNRVANLEWCSYEHNNRHWRHYGAVERGRQGVRGLTNGEAEQIRSLYATGHYVQRELARMFGTKQQVICTIVNGKGYNFSEVSK